MNKRKNTDESVIFQQGKWPKTAKNPASISALVSSSKSEKRPWQHRQWLGVWLPFLDVFRTRMMAAKRQFGSPPG
jgi:hypothetical protein